MLLNREREREGEVHSQLKVERGKRGGRSQRFGNNLKAIKVDVAAACKRGAGDKKVERWERERERDIAGLAVRQARCANCDSNWVVQGEDKAHILWLPTYFAAAADDDEDVGKQTNKH